MARGMLAGEGKDMGNIDNRAMRAAVLAAILALAAGCGGSDEPTKAKNADKAKLAKEAAKAQSEDARFASAVYLEKGMPAVDVKYDLLSKPVAGQPFELELLLEPRLNSELLEFNVAGMPGIDVIGGGAASFQNVQGHQRYTAKAVIQPVQAGVYYLAVTAKASSKVQSDVVGFSVPVVVAAAPPGSVAAPTAAPGAAATPAAAGTATAGATPPGPPAPAPSAPAK